MSKAKSEIGISIVQNKASEEYSQKTNEFYFFPKSYSCGKILISVLSISENAANQVIEKLKLKKEEDFNSYRWISKLEQKQNLYLKKLLASKKDKL